MSASEVLLDAIVRLVMDLADREREILSLILQTDDLTEDARKALSDSHNHIEGLQVNVIEALKRKNPRGRPPDKLWKN
jgi:hypothetical protein